jgi:hypothetical protein
MKVAIEVEVPDGFERRAELSSAVKAAAFRVVDCPPPPPEPRPALALARRESAAEVWLDDTYIVRKRVLPEVPGGPRHLLSVSRHDRTPVLGWEVLQRVKNELCGPEADGVEVYPGESRCVRAANTRHLWVAAPGEDWPVPDLNELT